MEAFLTTDIQALADAQGGLLPEEEEVWGGPEVHACRLPWHPRYYPLPSLLGLQLHISPWHLPQQALQALQAELARKYAPPVLTGTQLFAHLEACNLLPTASAAERAMRRAAR